jgi:Rrf2 family protein
MLDLALHNGDSPVIIKDIAERLDLSERYLENIMAMLAAAGLVRSLRGSQGGFRLARPPQEIRMSDIVRVTEGSLALVPCQDDSGALECKAVESCATFDVWKKLKESITEVLGSYTLQDLVDSHRRKKLESHDVRMYFI